MATHVAGASEGYLFNGKMSCHACLAVRSSRRQPRLCRATGEGERERVVRISRVHPTLPCPSQRQSGGRGRPQIEAHAMDDTQPAEFLSKAWRAAESGRLIRSSKWPHDQRSLRRSANMYDAGRPATGPRRAKSSRRAATRPCVAASSIDSAAAQGVTTRGPAEAILLRC